MTEETMHLATGRDALGVGSVADDPLVVRAATGSVGGAGRIPENNAWSFAVS